MRKVSFVCLLSVISLLLVLSSPLVATSYPLYPPPPILDIPAADIQTGVSFGYSLAAGDLNGDGHADIVVGVPFYEESGPITNQGRVYVYDGAGGCLITTLTYPGSARAVKFGWAVAIGDFDGDGNKDIIVGAPFDDGPTGTSSEGRVYVYFGPSFASYMTLDKPGVGQDDAHFGYAVAAGSTDADAADEIIVGAPDEDVGGFANRGKGYHFKYSSGVAVSTDLSPAINQTDMWYGFSVAMGDLMNHGGGQKDPIFGAPGYNNGIMNEAGRVYWWDLSGPTSSTIDDPFPEAVAHFGWAVVAGDVAEASGGADGNVELVVGAPHKDIIPLYSNLGMVHVLDNTGTSKYAVMSPNWMLDGNEFGSSLALGDIDGDGIPDIIVGAPAELVDTTIDSGRVYAFHSSPPYVADGSLLTLGVVTSISGVGTETEYLYDSVVNDDITCGAGENCANVTEYHNHEANAAFGWAVASANINNAPYDDLVASGIMLDVGLTQNVGRAYLFFEDAQPEAPTGLAPTGTVTTKTVTLQTDGNFVDKDEADCTPSPVWSDSHKSTQWRISNTSIGDCTSGGAGVVYDQTYTVPTSYLYATPSIDLTSYGFNFGDTVYWCVRYQDSVNVWSNWSGASFTIGVPDLQVTAVADVLGTDSPYAAPTYGNAAAVPPPPIPPAAAHVGSVDFKTVSCDDCRTVDITVTNAGTATAHVTAVTLQNYVGTNGTYTINSVTPGVPFDVAPSGTFVVNVTFCGGVPAPETTTEDIVITYDDPIDFTINMTGASAAPVGDVQPNVGPNGLNAFPPPTYGVIHDFGDVTIGDPPVCFEVDVVETGGAVPLKVTGVVLTELFVSPLAPLYSWEWKDAADQAYWTAHGFLYVPAGGTKKIKVCFDPKAGSGCGVRMADLAVTSNSGCTATTEGISFTANVVGPDLEGRWTSFSSWSGSTLVRGTLRIANIGTKDLIDTIVDPGKQYFRVWFYLSSDATLDTLDTPLYSQDVSYLLRAGQVKSIGFNYTFASSQSGNYIIAVIDSENNFVECIDFIGSNEPPAWSSSLPAPAYFPFPPGNTNINNIAVPAKWVLGAFPIP